MLDRLAVTNFKAFATADISLAPYTLLTGLNSSGKSTVMQAIALLRQSHDLLEDSESGFLLNGDLVDLGTGRDILHEDYVSTGADSSAQITLTVDSAGTAHSWSAEYEQDADILRLTARPTPDAIGGLSIFGPGFQYLRADRISPSVTYPRSHEVAIRRGFLGTRGEHTVNYLWHFQDEPVEDERLRHPEARSPRLLDQAEAHCP